MNDFDISKFQNIRQNESITKGGNGISIPSQYSQDIGSLLGGPREKPGFNIFDLYSSIYIEDGKEVISKEQATYNNKKGVLIRYADGTLTFQQTKSQSSFFNQNNMTYIKEGLSDFQANINQTTVYTFKNENDFNNQKPVSNTTYSYNSQTKKFIKESETTYKYNSNGKISESETKDKAGKLLNKTTYNTDGKISQTITYKNGKAIFTNKYIYDGNTQTIQQFDKNNNKIRTTINTYNSEGKISSNKIMDAEGRLTSESEFDNSGRLKTNKKYNPETGKLKEELTINNNITESKKYNNAGVLTEYTKKEDGYITQKNTYHPNGKIKTETIYNTNGSIKTEKIYDENGKLIKQTSNGIDGHFGSSSQKRQGDCYLMASINAIRECSDGQEILSNLVTTGTNANGEKTYTVTFPGAKLAAQGLLSDNRINNNKMYITGTYTFTESEIQEILSKAGRQYSEGDGDIILLEAAFEKYRQEVNKTIKANNIGQEWTQAGLTTGRDEDNILHGGHEHDAIFILTGKKSEYYLGKPQCAVDIAALSRGEIQVKGALESYTVKAAVSEIEGPIRRKYSDVDKMLDKIMKDAQDGHISAVATAGLKTTSRGEHGSHAFTIKSATATTVTLINPWHPDKELVMTREDFKRCLKNMNYTTMDKPSPGGVGGEEGNLGGGGESPVDGNGNIETSGTYRIPRGISYDNMIKQMLKEQGIPTTAENIKKAKQQFETLNPNAVKTYKGRNRNMHGVRYVLANDLVKVPKFKV